MVVVSIVAILLAVGIPFMGDVLARNESTSTAGALRAALDRAKYEAGARGVRVGLCASGNAAADEPVCDTSSAPDWSQGWVAWIDANGDGKLGSAEKADDNGDGVLDVAETLLFRQVSLKSGSGSGPAIVGDAAVVRFAPPAMAAASSGGSFCVSRKAAGMSTGQFPRCVTVSLTGIVAVAEGVCSPSPTC